MVLVKVSLAKDQWARLVIHYWATLVCVCARNFIIKVELFQSEVIWE